MALALLDARAREGHFKVIGDDSMPGLMIGDRLSRASA
jgi:hypothetical protein